MPITPDTKDWTWVLREPCPECGFDAPRVPHDELSGSLLVHTTRWVEVLAGPDVTARAHDDIWSPLEYACHLRDAFTVIDGRLELMLSHDGPTFPNWDQDATA
ncbi:MAG TPA: DinB family protein, partial [Acidimicrobiales bacterium]